MEIKDLIMGKKLSDEELEQVAGGKGKHTNAWNCCDKYVCQSCGSTGQSRANHAPDCPVPAIICVTNVRDSSYQDLGLMKNGCWSCKHAWYGENYPKDEDDLWCDNK